MIDIVVPADVAREIAAELMLSDELASWGEYIFDEIASQMAFLHDIQDAADLWLRGVALDVRPRDRAPLRGPL